MTSHEVDKYLETEPVQVDEGYEEYVKKCSDEDSNKVCAIHDEAFQQLWPNEWACESCLEAANTIADDSQDDERGL